MSEFPDPTNSAPAEPDRAPAEKRRIRAELLRRRRTLPCAEYDQHLLAQLGPLLRGADRVAGYAPLRFEPGGPQLPAAIAAHVGTLLLPVLLPDRDLDWAAFTPAGAPGVVETPGMWEPTGPRLGLTALAGVDLVLVPAVAVARSTRVRLGRGGGSYDRALARLAAGTPVVALLHPGELLDELPYEPHDQRVTGVLSADGYLEL